MPLIDSCKYLNSQTHQPSIFFVYIRLGVSHDHQWSMKLLIDKK